MSNENNDDYQRRFGGLQRLYSNTTPLEAAHIMVAGIGGVGAWCVEALARCGINQISIIDLDHIAESNINRQIHALTSTLGQSKVLAMRDRILEINSLCQVNVIDDFIDEDNTQQILKDYKPDLLIDCTDQISAKIAMVVESKRLKIPMLCCGGAGGKTDALTLKQGDIAHSTNDALLSKIRYTLRRQYNYAKPTKNAQNKISIKKMGVSTLWFDQQAILPQQWLDQPNQDNADNNQPLQGLSCAGYGSVVTVTASMGFAAANWAITKLTK